MKHISYILSFIAIIFYSFVLCAYSKVELPDIPPRPTIKELKKSLSSELQNVEQINPSVKIKNFSNGESKSFFKSDFISRKIKDDYDHIVEESFRLDPTRLFSLSLNAIKSLNVSLESFDTSKGEIIAVDDFRNTIVIQVSSNDKNDSKIKIIGYASKFGKKILKNNVQKLLEIVSENKTK